MPADSSLAAPPTFRQALFALFQSNPGQHSLLWIPPRMGIQSFSVRENVMPVSCCVSVSTAHLGTIPHQAITAVYTHIVGCWGLNLLSTPTLYLALLRSWESHAIAECVSATHFLSSDSRTLLLLGFPVRSKFPQFAIESSSMGKVISHFG